MNCMDCGGSECVCRLRRKARELEAENASLTSRVAELEGLCADIGNMFNAPCRFDHHGYCQEHFLEQPCTIAKLKAALSGANGGKRDAQFKPIKDFTCAIHEYDLHGTKCVHCGHVQGE